MNAPEIHSLAVCLSDQIGEGVRVGAFSRIGSGVKIAEGTVIGAGVSVPEGVSIGASVVIEDGAVLSPGMSVGAHSKIGSGAVFAASRLSGSSAAGGREITRVGAHCIIGANATVCAGISLGDHGVVDAGSVICQSTQPYAVMAGNPARVVGFTGVSEGNDSATSRDEGDQASLTSRVRGVRPVRLPFISDPRGNLTVGEFGRSLPFEPKRYFVTFDVPNAHLRGEHAHKVCDQFLVCVRGSCAVVVDDGQNREEFQLDHPTFGVFVPRMVWATEYKHSADSVLLVFASEFYDPDDYIRDYDEFLARTAELRK